MPLKQTKRFSTDIPIDRHERFTSAVPYGIRGILAQRILDLTLLAVEHGGPGVVGSLFEGDLRPVIRALTQLNDNQLILDGSNPHS